LGSRGSGAYPEIFRGGFEFFLNEQENLEGFWGFFLNKPLKIKKISQKGGVDPPEYTPEEGLKGDPTSFKKLSINLLHYRTLPYRD